MDNKSFDEKKYKQQFDKENYSRVVVALKKEKAINFKELCKSLGVSQSSVLESAIDDFLLQNKK